MCCWVGCVVWGWVSDVWLGVFLLSWVWGMGLSVWSGVGCEVCDVGLGV